MIVGIHTVLGGTSPSIAVDVQWHTTLNSGSATHLYTTPPTVTSTTTGDTDASPNNTEFLPGDQIWMESPTVTTAPTYMATTVYGYKKNNQW